MQNKPFTSLPDLFRLAGCLLSFLCLLALGGAVLVQNPLMLLSSSGTPEERETAITDLLPRRALLLSPSAAVNQTLSRRYYAGDGIFIDNNEQMSMGSHPGSVDFALEHVTALNQYCQDTGRDFLYVILPGKPLRDEELLRYGIPCARNATADLFRDGLLEKGIPFFDARTLFQEDEYDLFYKTDHHWTAEAGLRTASAIAQTLNAEFGYSLDEKALDSSRFKKEVRKNYWVGESGRKILGAACKIRDDLILIRPSFPVHLEFSDETTSKKASGDFSILTDPKLLENVDGTGSEPTPYYYYTPCNDIVKIRNKDVETGNILFVKDSFSNVVLPFLSLSTGQITGWDMRKDPNLYSHLEQHPEIKTVIVMYNIAFVPTLEMNDFR